MSRTRQSCEEQGVEASCLIATGDDLVWDTQGGNDGFVSLSEFEQLRGADEPQDLGGVGDREESEENRHQGEKSRPPSFFRPVCRLFLIRHFAKPPSGRKGAPSGMGSPRARPRRYEVSHDLSSRIATRPGPLEIETPEMSGDIDDFADAFNVWSL